LGPDGSEGGGDRLGCALGRAGGLIGGRRLGLVAGPRLGHGAVPGRRSSRRG